LRMIITLTVPRQVVTCPVAVRSLGALPGSHLSPS
jgi:hypothetical protein